MSDLASSYDSVRNLETVLANQRYLHWVNVELSSYQWWLLTALSIVSLLVWLKFVDRTRLIELLLYGSIIAILSVTLDEFGYEYRLWSYNVHLLSQLPHISWIYYFIMPIIYMLIYQFYNDWRSFSIAMIIYAAIGAFVMEPLLVFMDAYVQLKWRYIYSFPIYLAMGIAAKGLVKKLLKISNSVVQK